MGEISVVIPVMNEEEKIGQCLEAVFAQSIKPHEVIVVDGHSSDLTVERAKEFPVKVVYEEYHTRAGACQIGVMNADGEFVAFTDADCIPEKNWLEDTVKEFDGDIVGVGCGIKNVGEGLWEKSINLVAGTFLGSANSVQGRFFKDKRYVNSISGCNSMYHKEDIFKVGGFDVGLSTAEDTELSRKMLRIGKLLYTPDAVILHNHKRGLKDFSKRMYQYGYGRAKGRLWDLQAIPPILALLLLVSLVFTPWIFLGMVGVYVIMVAGMGVWFVVQEKSFKYMVTVPIVYMIEHGLYTVGFWRGIVDPIGSA
ncbi:MAG: Dolichyl N-acetyl-alpha-D-glucosaminyl phosphate3-beta-D-2,3-diacetamido-2,3-dideoxy-beta-D-glucu ronosyltransferase [Candidatus Argoarchaeum ethanivorans]|uniref:Dolichyl N-acetyl-alpha-D-glucosaminyl phosphate3-beta-D-2,3-diacetamido-2,3-dideoxy-beta-D-glucu ronosyltransferase n=1 Tax=Candidatus Argoarchaeum ethanivorans TaxID=2608793 RepID=A0A811TGJ0_9EURY|nr:MAG: Dolichyl N-acetyl-alpha-D-glucosaminyl phosphate3-beta-D-2,3-diacetamido-2,3-dideoxy-beta-D-glucu ronosyltransferase [Candidatus Argoarchaeum ethanivorans]